MTDLAKKAANEVTDAKEVTVIINFGLILSAVLFGIIPAFSEKN